MAYNKTEIAHRLLEIRNENNLSMQDFANLIGVSGKSTVNEWEKGRSIPSKKTLAKIADKLNINENYILYGNFKDYINQLILITIKNQSDDQLTSTFFDYLTAIDALAKFKSYEDSQIIETIQDQIRVREEILNIAIKTTIDDNISELTEFLTKHQIDFGTPISLTLETINNFFLKKLNRLHLTKRSYIQELISNTDLTAHKLDSLNEDDAKRIKTIINNFQYQLLQLDN